MLLTSAIAHIEDLDRRRKYVEIIEEIQDTDLVELEALINKLTFLANHVDCAPTKEPLSLSIESSANDALTDIDTNSYTSKKVDTTLTKE